MAAACLGLVLGGCVAGGAEYEAEEGVGEEPTGEVQQDWSIAHKVAPTEGHEIILKAGVALANTMGTNFPTISPTENCRWWLQNPLLVGNCATDQGSLKIASMVNVSTTDEWHTQPALQQIHFLRNYKGTSGVVGGWRACVAARDRIVAATQKAVALWRKGQTTEAYFYIGHASHILQDSFAPGHTERQSDNLHLKNICSYKKPVTGVCNHGGDPEGWPGDLVGLYPTLTQEATVSTAGYLRVVWQLLGNTTVCKADDNDCETAVRKVMQPFFDYEVDEYTGKLQCTFLPNQPTVSWQYVGTRGGVDKIAACENGTLYALHAADRSIYKNTSGGSTNGWVYVDKRPSAKTITCGGNTLYAYDYDKTFRKYVGGTTKWQHIQTWTAIERPAANFEGIFGIETNGTVWAQIPTWYKVGKAALPTSFAAGYELDPTTQKKVGRLFKLINHDLYMSTANGRDAHWQYIDRPYYAKEIAAGANHVLWALNTDGRWYRGTINE